MIKYIYIYINEYMCWYCKISHVQMKYACVCLNILNNFKETLILSLKFKNKFYFWSLFNWERICEKSLKVDIGHSEVWMHASVKIYF